MSAAGDARERQQAAQAPVSRPNAAPVDSGAIGRLSDAERAEIGWAVERDWQLRDQRDDWDGLYAVVERIVREHTDRALAEVEEERDEIAGRLSELLCDLTGGLLSKTGYSVRDMVAAIESEFEKSTREEIADALAEVEKRIKDKLGVTSRALPIVRAARQEQGR